MKVCILSKVLAPNICSWGRLYQRRLSKLINQQEQAIELAILPVLSKNESPDSVSGFHQPNAILAEITFRKPLRLVC